MIRVYFLFAVIAAFFWLKRFLSKSAAERQQYIKQSMFVFIGLIIILLAMIGRLHWLLAALGGLFALMLRFLPVVMRYAPQIQKIIQFLYRSKVSTDKPNQAVKQSTSLTKQEACDILGISIRATKQEIIAAHRKLILKNHPDRGGSAHLAAQINQAKDCLLQK